MRFLKGNRQAKGGKREGAGRPTIEEREFKIALKEEVERQGRLLLEKIAKRYFARATGKNGDKVLMHLIDRVFPPAPRDVNVNHSNGIEGFYRALENAKRREAELKRPAIEVQAAEITTHSRA